MKASAPGKILLLGDYAVLAGGVALVAAVDRRAHGESDRAGPSSALLDAVRARARETLAREPPLLSIDSQAFLAADGHKLGIGSSAAVAVVASALALGTGDERCLALALAAHLDAAGGIGSGVDVAAAFHGGVIAARKGAQDIEALPAHIGKLQLLVFDTGASADTRALVTACQASPKWREWQKVLQPLADEGHSAWRSQNSSAFLSVVARYARALQGLGEDAGVPIVTEPMAQLMRAAAAVGGAAKPSGAGGGDVAIAFVPDRAHGPGLAEASGCVLLDLGVERQGLRLEPA